MMSENLVAYVLDAQQGNEDAFAKLYSRTLKNSYYLCLKLTADNVQAEEVLRKGYASAFCSIGKLKRPEAFEAWLKQKMATAYKSGKQFYFGDVDGDSPALASEFLPASVLDDDSLCRKVEDYVAYLPDEQRVVAVLYYCVGMPVDFIAKFLGVSASTVGSLLEKAKQGITEPLNLGDVTLSEDTLPVLTKIFQRSANSVKIENDLVRQTFIYAIDCFHDGVNPVEDVTVTPDPPKQEAPKAEEENGDAAENAEEAEEPAEEKPLTGEDLLKEINQSISDITGAPLEGEAEENSDAEEGVYISQIPLDDDEPAQQDYPVDEKPEKKKKSFAPKKGGVKNGKTKLYAIIAAAVLVIVIVIVAIAVKSGKSDSSDTTTVTNQTVAADAEVKQEFREVSEFTQYSKIEYFNESCALIQDAETGKYGLMDYKGNVKLAPEYYSIIRCSYGREYSDRNSYHYLVQSEAGGDLYEINMGTFEIQSVAHTTHNIESDDFDLSKKYDERDRYHNGYAAVRDAETGKWGYISEESGKLVIDCLYETVNDGLDQSEYQKVDYCLAVDNGMVAVKKGGKMGVIDINGQTIVNFEYTEILQGDGGVFIAQKNNKWGVILVGSAVDTYDTASAAVSPAITNLDTILAEYTALEGTYQAWNDVNVRTEIGGSGDATLLGTLTSGDQVTVVAEGTSDTGSTWYCIEFNDGYGWVSSTYLSAV